MSQTESAYLGTIERVEPAIAPIDLPAAAASIAVSLKRIADSLDKITACDSYGLTGSASLAQALIDGLRGTR